MNLDKNKKISNIINPTSNLYYAIFGTVLSIDIVESTKKYKKYLDVGTFEYMLAGILLSDLDNTFTKELEKQKTDDILDDTNLFNENFIINTLVTQVAKLCKRKGKDLKSSIKFLFIALEDKSFSKNLSHQLNYTGNTDYSRYLVSYKIQKFHVLLALPFIRTYKSL